MTVYFWSKKHGDWCNHSNVVKLERCQLKNGGRLTNFWLLYFADGTRKSLKCLDYELSGAQSH